MPIASDFTSKFIPIRKYAMFCDAVNVYVNERIYVCTCMLCIREYVTPISDCKICALMYKICHQ